MTGVQTCALPILKRKIDGEKNDISSNQGKGLDLYNIIFAETVGLPFAPIPISTIDFSPKPKISIPSNPREYILTGKVSLSSLSSGKHFFGLLENAAKQGVGIRVDGADIFLANLENQDVPLGGTLSVPANDFRFKLIYRRGGTNPITTLVLTEDKNQNPICYGRVTTLDYTIDLYNPDLHTPWHIFFDDQNGASELINKQGVVELKDTSGTITNTARVRNIFLKIR